MFLVELSENAPVMAKVADFGLSRKATPALGDTLQTWQWLAPEVFDSNNIKGYDQRSDVYSFGIVFWEIIVGPGDLHVPFSEYERKEQHIKMDIISKNLRPSLPPDAPKDIRDLITKCWSANPDDRPTFVDICSQLGNKLGVRDPERDRYKVVKHSILEEVKLINKTSIGCMCAFA